MKQYKIASLLTIMILCLLSVGCSSYAVTPDTSSYFHLDETRPYVTKTYVKPNIQSTYSQNFPAVDLAMEQDYANTSTVMVINLDSNIVEQCNNPYGRIYPASTTKIMTALLVLERGDLEAEYTITEPITFTDSMAVIMGLMPGDKVKVKDLFYAMMLESDNDCAVALARYIGGSEAEFVNLMNERAVSLGATHTHFTNPHGLQSENHYTTGYDLSLIFAELIKHEAYIQAASMKQYTFCYSNETGKQIEKTANSTNMFIQEAYHLPEDVQVLAGKTGTTNEAGCCLALYIKKGETPYIVLMCGANTHQNLYIQLQDCISNIGQ